MIEHKITAAKQNDMLRRQQTVSGYGSKLRTSFMVQLDAKQRWYRVYCICYSNVGSLYVIVKGERLFVRDEFEVQDLAQTGVAS